MDLLLKAADYSKYGWKNLWRP